MERSRSERAYAGASRGLIYRSPGRPLLAAEVQAQPGIYSPDAGASSRRRPSPDIMSATPGASSETPDDPGSYTPYAGMTAPLQAQAPVISGTGARLSIQSGQTDRPFSTVKITDGNTDTTDSLSIQITGGGGKLSARSFRAQGEARTACIILSGTAAQITTELEALVFTPNNVLRDDDIYFDRHDERRHEREPTRTRQ